MTTNTKHELWSEVDGYPGYRISSFGLVERFQGDRWHPKKVFYAGKGYAYVQFSRKGKARTFLLHALVMQHFGPAKPSQEHQVAHNDGTKRNNRLDNLRWATAIENCDDRKLHGTHYVGEKTNSVRLTEAQVLEIRARHAAGETCRSLSRIYDVADSTIGRVVKGITWSHLPPQAWRAATKGES